MNLPEIPSRIKKLQRNEKGYPVPWFVKWIDGKPDFRVMDGDKWVQAIKYKVCWICGEGLGRYKVFVIGPMCAVNRTSSEPPSHLECAVFSAKACPFLTDPSKVRRETGLTGKEKSIGGISITRNPGVTLVWTTLSYKVHRVPGGNGIQPGHLIEIGDPIEVRWYAEGRVATREEIMHSIETGLPILRKEAEKEGDEAIAQLDLQVKEAMLLVPA